ncbi:hypothetical protein PR202_ga08475 [Eleusine coracana subsp. coracana]|uniref:Nucleotide-diphospho-sugar transferase domain-containing protein n=1 Tax=Eleusine coracana subsp. coracana TaxID=191504 RepID=A0AAV5C2M4_ELECO|nr:hypothetical protein PR202_ga08475 [Eleusine coracana subsp. coracana]
MSCSLDNSKIAPVLLDNEINCGFYYMKSTSRSVTLIKRWIEGWARFPGENEQVVLSKIKSELVGEVGVRMEALETEFVSGFCDFQKRFDKVCTMHANCCLGLENKVFDLNNIAAGWKNYTSLVPEQRKEASISATPPSMCRKSMGWS